MKEAIKRILVLLLSLTLLIAMCGCGKEEQSNIIKKFEDEKTVTLSMLTSKLMSDNFWTGNYITPDGTNIKIAEYTADYYSEKNLTYREMLERRLESNVDIDIYLIHAEDVIDFAQKGYWMDLKDLKAVSSLSKEALNQSIYDGKVTSIPIAYTGFAFWWNVDMLREHNLSVPSNRTEFLGVCESLKQAGITPYISNKGYALTVPAMAVGFADLYKAENKEQLIQDLSLGTTPVSTYMKKGFEFIAMMADKGYLDPEYTQNTVPREGDIEDFLAGRGAFICAPIEANLQSEDFEIAVTGIPVLEDGMVSVVGTNYCIAINPNSPKVQYAIEFLDGLITPQWLAEAVSTEYALPSCKGEYDLSYLHESHRDFARLVLEGAQIPNQDFNLHFNTWECIRDICREICGGLSSEDAARKYDSIQQEQIAQYNDSTET